MNLQIFNTLQIPDKMENASTSVNTLYDYAFVLPFERNFSPYDAKRWMNEIWHTGFYFSAIYILLVFGIKHLMTNSKPFSLNKPLLAWNLALSTFSAIAFCRTAPEFWHTLTNHGLHHSICVPRYVLTMSMKN